MEHHHNNNNKRYEANVAWNVCWKYFTFKYRQDKIDFKETGDKLEQKTFNEINRAELFFYLFHEQLNFICTVEEFSEQQSKIIH